ncbi:MAG: hypothetical protein AAF566_05845 [Pseudomonadota bacterium]
MKDRRMHRAGTGFVASRLAPAASAIACAIPALLALWFFGIVALGLLVALSLAASGVAQRIRSSRGPAFRLS